MLTFGFLRQADWINAQRSVGYPCALLAVYIFLVVIWIAQVPVIPRHDGVEFSQDFMNVYAAGKTVHEESAAQVYDWKFQKEQQQHLKATGSGAAPDEHYVPWWYPPTFLCVAWLLALAPYYGALAIYLIGGLAAYAVSIYRLAGWKQAKWAIIAFPGVYGNLFAGQNGFITTALMAGGLSLVARTPVAAGVFFGALSFKPQFFVLIPIALLAGRY